MPRGNVFSPHACSGSCLHRSPSEMCRAAFSSWLPLNLETWDLLWPGAAEPWVGWWVLEPFGAEGPELGETQHGDGCKVLHLVARQCCATLGKDALHPHPSSLVGDGARRRRRHPHPVATWVSPMARMGLNPSRVAAKH